MSAPISKQPTLNSILGISIIGLPTAINNILQYDLATNTLVWAVGGAFNGTHTSLTEKEVATVIDHADDSINAAKLKVNSVITAKIAALAVTQAKLALLSVGTPQLIDLSVTEPKIAALAVTQAKLALLSVGTPQLIDLSVTEPKIAALAVSLAKMKTEAGNANLFIGYDALGVVVAKAGGSGLGDLEFLRDKELSGDLIISQGQLTGATTGNLASVTPAIGKTFFNVSAMASHSGAAASITIIKLINDVTTLEVVNAAQDVAPNHNFLTKADSLIGDGVKIFAVNKSSGTGTVDGTLEGWIQNT